MTGKNDFSLLEKVSKMNDINLLTTVKSQRTRSETSKSTSVVVRTQNVSPNATGRIVNHKLPKPPLPPKPKLLPVPKSKVNPLFRSVKVTQNSSRTISTLVGNSSSLLISNNNNSSVNYYERDRSTENNLIIRNTKLAVRGRLRLPKPPPPPRTGSLLNRNKNIIKSPIKIEIIDSAGNSPVDEIEEAQFHSEVLQDVSSSFMEKTLEEFQDSSKPSSEGSSSLSETESEEESTKKCLFSDELESVPNFLHPNFLTNDSTCSTPSPECCDSDTNVHVDIISDEEKRKKKAFLVAREIMSTENSFVNILKLLNETFREFLSSKGCVSTAKSASQGCKAIPEIELNNILKHLPNLQSLNEGILGDFKNRIADWDTKPIIADVIVQKGPFLKIFATYIKEIETQTTSLSECVDRYSFFGQCLREFEASDDCLHLPVGRHLLAPMQRITRYKELVKSYLKNLREGDEDYQNALQAYDIVKEVVEHSNEAIRQLDNFSRLLSLQERLNGFSSSAGEAGSNWRFSQGHFLIEPGRSFVKDGQVMKLCRRGVRMVYLILLSDSLLYTTQVSPGGPQCPLKLRYKLPLEGMRVEIPRADEFNNEVSVISTSRSFTIRVDTPCIRDSWLLALQNAIAANASRRNSFQLVSEGYQGIENLQALGRQAPVWIPDDRVSMCQLCTAVFMLTFRRHHCRACGKVICSTCSKSRHPLVYLQRKRARVCDLCMDILEDEISEEVINGGGGDTSGKLEAPKRKPKKGIRDSHRWRIRKIPERLMEVCGSDQQSQMCGYLNHSFKKGIWRRNWFVLKERVLYEYAAPQDVCALSTLPVLGYEIKVQNENSDSLDVPSSPQNFSLHHENQIPIFFEADTPDLTAKWIEAMKEAVDL